MINNCIELTINEHIAHVVLSRPEKMNALDTDMFAAIPKVGEQIKQDPSVRVVVISGAGKNFSSGLDKSIFAKALEQKGVSLNPDEAPLVLADRTHGVFNALQALVWLWREMPVPVIAAIDGFALGGGLQIALGADMRYATKDSQFSILEMRWGLIPDMGSTQIMRHMIADDVIRELTYTARIFSAQEAKEWGFITDIVDNPLAHAMQLAEQICLKNPDAIRASKRMLEASHYQTVAEGMLTESTEQDKIMGSANQVEAVMAELQKRKPKFTD